MSVSVVLRTPDRKFIQSSSSLSVGAASIPALNKNCTDGDHAALGGWPGEWGGGLQSLVTD